MIMQLLHFVRDALERRRSVGPQEKTEMVRWVGWCQVHPCAYSHSTVCLSLSGWVRPKFCTVEEDSFLL